MGTHPIFESDFDCLTDFMKLTNMSRVAPVWPAILFVLIVQIYFELRLLSLLESQEAFKQQNTSSVDNQRERTQILKVTLPKLVIYNRVPKCGSTTMDSIISKLKEQNKFNVVNDIAPGLKHVLPSEQDELSKIKEIRNL